MMYEYQVKFDDGVKRVTQRYIADHVNVGESGALEFRFNGNVLACLAPGTWLWCEVTSEPSETAKS